jgi:hypothetical protein
VTWSDNGFLLADEAFFSVFLPYELRLTQRRAMVWSASGQDVPNQFLGLYVFGLAPREGGELPQAGAGLETLEEHVASLIRVSTRESDVPGRIGPLEFLVVARDLSAPQSYVPAQRFLTSAIRSDTIRAAGLLPRVDYLVYPLSLKPNYPPSDWRSLLDLTRTVGRIGRPREMAAGCGLMRGPEAEEVDIPETDLVMIALQDPKPLLQNGLLKVSRIHMMPGG